MIAVILGAGFSCIAGLPLASQLFESSPEVDRITRRRLVQRVVAGWERWQARTRAAPEEYLAFLQDKGGKEWHDALWFVSLIIALKLGRVELVGSKPTITRHNLDRTSVATHEQFWSEIFRKTFDVSVVTTNYDILPERGIRNRPRPRVPRPGFHYGDGPELLAGGGYPSYAHIQRIAASGSVPLYKLHGSVSWSFREGRLVRYHDCRPAIRGDAAIVAPMTTKVIPPYLQRTWQQAGQDLSSSDMWIVVGYSLPQYDEAVRDLLAESGRHAPDVHIFDPCEKVAPAFAQLLPGSPVSAHDRLPESIHDLELLMGSVDAP